MVYDQNRPDDQRPTGEERAARRRIGRSWGPPADEGAETADAARQGMGQAPEQYRFDPDRGRRHRYSDDPTGQVPNVPVEMADTGPMVPATRRPAPGEQFEPIPAAPQQTPQAPQGFQAEQAPVNPFAPPAPNQDHAPAPQHQEYAPPPAQEFGVPQQHAAPPLPPAPDHASLDRAAPPSQPAQQFYSAPAQDFGVPQQHPGYSAPPLSGDYAAHPAPGNPASGNPAPPQPAPPGPNQEFAQPPAPEPQSPQQHFGVPAQPQHTGPIEVPQAAAPSAPPAYAPPQQDFSAPPGPNPEFSAPPRQRPEPRAAEAAPSAPPAPAPEVQRQPVPSTPPAPATPPAPSPVVEQQTDQFPIVQPPLTEVSPAAVPSPPVTEQAPLRSSPANRPPIAEPTPPATVENAGPMPANPAGTVGAPDTESARLVDAVRQVPGVRDAFHVTAPDGASSLRLELEEGVDPDEVHAVVSAVVNEQRAVEPGPQSSEEPEIRGHVESASTDIEVASVGPVELRRVEIESAGLEAEVSVTLALGDIESTGKVAVPPIDWHIQHAAAAATVEALRPRLGAGDVRVEVEHASIVPTGPVKTAVVVILWLDGRSVRRLSGAAVVTAERARAVVSATLGALAAEVAH
ncbi:hypothetical protein SAMN05216298_2260 [Glycomyces sambucus]|uniref:Uncharacterized protein n=1 Tax=Glycomyces sambucus TaxID=380244 RepID=A0A1G9GKF7_9ACTN|nr:hypothetical protein [Glycomyces sambucus]SDL01126.1 hypothetical protein SAMN05216298_2260 [Glycomyces sambucus]